MNTFTSVFLIVCAFLLGVAVAGYVVSLRHEQKLDADEASQTRDLLRMRKDAASGALEVVIAGQAFKSVSEMSSVQRSLAGFVLNDLKAWLTPQGASAPAAANATPAEGTSSAEGASPAATAVPEPSTAEAVPDTAPAQPEIPPPESGDVLGPQESVPAEGEGAEDTKKDKRGGFMGFLSRTLATDVPVSRLAPVSIAVQVNEVLQKKLKGTQLESRGIALMELPGQDMVVMIGLDKYDSVSAVPDDEIRAVIQSAVNEWLVRSTK